MSTDCATCGHKAGDCLLLPESSEAWRADVNALETAKVAVQHKKDYDLKRVNLCDTCLKCFATCNNGEEGKDFFFGLGIGFDNVYRCDAYLGRGSQ